MNSRTASVFPASVFREVTLKRALFAVVCMAAFIKVFANALVLEDAYITFRVIDNFVHGYGLRWNVDERVQVYTHPLWMLLHIPFYAVFGHIYVVNIVLSTLCMLAAVGLLCTLFPSAFWRKTVAVLLPLALSTTFNDFAVCGLENPLSFLMLAWFMREWFRDGARFSYDRLLLAATLLTLTRFDNMLLAAPAMLTATWRQRRELRAGKLLAVTSPLWLWLLFSLLYYGFIFPNTKYAKLNTGIDTWVLISHGLGYAKNFFYYDTVGFAVIAAALVYGAYHAALALVRRGGPESCAVAALAAGCLCHILYVIVIGGDFMSGRFFAEALIVAVGIMHAALRHCDRRIALGAAMALLGVYAVQERVFIHEIPYRGYPYDRRINDARREYAPFNGLFSERGHFFRTHTTHPWAERAKRHAGEKRLITSGGIGMGGYFSGPESTIIDFRALSDPLLARLPLSRHRAWRIGHFARDIPQGYIYFRATGDTSLMNPWLADYERKLWLVTSGPLFSIDRLKAIAGFQLGSYDRWRDNYLASLTHKSY